MQEKHPNQPSQGLSVEGHSKFLGDSISLCNSQQSFQAHLKCPNSNVFFYRSTEYPELNIIPQSVHTPRAVPSQVQNAGLALINFLWYFSGECGFQSCLKGSFSLIV